MILTEGQGRRSTSGSVLDDKVYLIGTGDCRRWSCNAVAAAGVADIAVVDAYVVGGAGDVVLLVDAVVVAVVAVAADVAEIAAGIVVAAAVVAGRFHH